MQEKVEQMAMMADMAEAEKMSEFAPEGSFKRDTVNRMIRSVNEMLKHFSANPIGEVAEDVEGPLPTDLVKALMMINSALEDAKMTDYIIDLEGLSDDRDLMMARGKIDTGAKDRAFIAFLRKPMPEQGTDVAVSVEVEEEVPPGFHRMPDGSIMADSEHEGMDKEEDVDKLLMSRM
tara:strand:- start:680 stop:1210 length:531 start_codon:yes stop_codon:yes gene_type:complete